MVTIYSAKPNIRASVYEDHTPVNGTEVYAETVRFDATYKSLESFLNQYIGDQEFIGTINSLSGTLYSKSDIPVEVNYYLVVAEDGVTVNQGVDSTGIGADSDAIEAELSGTNLLLIQHIGRCRPSYEDGTSYYGKGSFMVPKSLIKRLKKKGFMKSQEHLTTMLPGQTYFVACVRPAGASAFNGSQTSLVVAINNFQIGRVPFNKAIL
jgi:hypothetical protein